MHSTLGMKRNTLIAIAALAIVAAALTFWMRDGSDWKFVRQVTGFEFPVGTEYLAQYDNSEWFVVSVVRLPEEAISEFIHDHRFIHGNRQSMTTTAALPAEYRDVPDRADVLHLEGRTDYQSWQSALDTRSRLLWIHITYPDWGGTHSGTAPQPQDEKS